MIIDTSLGHLFSQRKKMEQNRCSDYSNANEWVPHIYQLGLLIVEKNSKIAVSFAARERWRKTRPPLIHTYRQLNAIHAERKLCCYRYHRRSHQIFMISGSAARALVFASKSTSRTIGNQTENCQKTAVLTDSKMHR